jgi:toxin ParE1/3/4
MSLLLHITPSAYRDLGKNAEYIKKESPRSALRFIEAVEATFQFLLAFPESGSIFDEEDSELAGIRFFLVSGFEHYLVFYQMTSTTIEVLRILHASRELFRLLKGSN